MSGITWRLSTPLKDPGAVGAVEERYGIRLPEALRTAILEHNGGVPSPSRCLVPGICTTRVKLLLSYNQDDPETVYDVLEFFLARSHKRLIPFASDPGSGYFCVKDGAVVYAPDEELVTVAVADSLDSFWEQLF